VQTRLRYSQVNMSKKRCSSCSKEVLQVACRYQPMLRVFRMVEEVFTLTFSRVLRRGLKAQIMEAVKLDSQTKLV